MLVAITRAISPAIVHCELTHQPRVAIDFALARAQHAEYEERLTEAGCTVERLQTTPDLADSVFIEDIAVVFPEFAVVTRPGAESRRAETPAVRKALEKYRTLRSIEAPGTLDGGDVLVMGHRVFVGRSRRTNPEGIEQLRRIVETHKYQIISVPVERSLHLKSAVSGISDDTLLINRRWVDADVFSDLSLVEVDESEPGAANALRIGNEIIFPAGYPKTTARLEAQGFRIRPIDVGELTKAEGAVTCCSLVFRA
jgi:dimethylargininase